MPTATFEITGKFEEPADCASLLYAPLAERATYRHSRVYEFEFEGDAELLQGWAYKTLVDHYAQELHAGLGTAITGHDFYLEIGMKPGALDNEKEAILSYYRTQKDKAFTITGLRILRRYYIFGSKSSEIFVRDMCNPAVNQHEVVSA